MDQASLSHLMESAARGRTLVYFRLSLHKPEFLDVCCVLPTIDEVRTFHSLVQLRPAIEYKLHEVMLRRCCFDEVACEWLLSAAPAGLLPRLIEAVIALSLPKGADALNLLLDTVRAGRDVFTTMRETALVGGIPPDNFDGLDIYQFFTRALVAEDRLLKAGAMDKPLHIKEKPRQKAMRGSVDFDAENRKIGDAMSGR